MNDVKCVNDSIFWWLEEIPIAELPDEARSTVEGYRNGKYTVTQATERLTSQCNDLILEWIATNNQLDSI